MTVNIPYSEFAKKAKPKSIIPLYTELLADMDTPVSVYRKVAPESEYSFLLESVEAGKNVGRYSFIGCDARQVFRSKGTRVEQLSQDEAKVLVATKRPMQMLRDYLGEYHFVKNPRLPSFCGGAVGYVAYDYIRFLEDIPDNNADAFHSYDVYFALYDMTIVFDHVRRNMCVVANVKIDERRGLKKAYDQACRRIASIIQQIQSKTVQEHVIAPSRKPGALSSNFTKKMFSRAVQTCKRYIKAGDILQGVISQTFCKKITCKPFDIYRTLRSINPSPYMFYLDFDGFKMIGSSPEIMVQLEGRKAIVRPIAGTRKRGQDDQEDERLIQDLLEDDKERAEHIMLVDLGRNDLGRVCQPGSVGATQLMRIEKYSHVLHIVSHVEGILKKKLDAFDLFEATFPAGTVSGAPKIRAMEIIDELEPSRRGPYAGAVGYFSFSGDSDTCITIRTIVVKDGVAYVQAGAGIVADSKPENEYMETINKAKAMIAAIDLAHQGTA